jgi:hypothetical protein
MDESKIGVKPLSLLALGLGLLTATSCLISLSLLIGQVDNIREELTQEMFVFKVTSFSTYYIKISSKQIFIPNCSKKLTNYGQLWLQTLVVLSANMIFLQHLHPTKRHQLQMLMDSHPEAMKLQNQRPQAMKHQQVTMDMSLQQLKDQFQPDNVQEHFSQQPILHRLFIVSAIKWNVQEVHLEFLVDLKVVVSLIF